MIIMHAFQRLSYLQLKRSVKKTLEIEELRCFDECLKKMNMISDNIWKELFCKRL